MIERDTETAEDTLPTVKAFDAQARRRAAELLRLNPHSQDPWERRSQAARESAFCLGYKAGVVDFGVAFREQSGASVSQVSAIHAAATAWRDATPSTREARTRELIAAIDAAREPQP